MAMPWPCPGDIHPLVHWLQPEEAQGEREKNSKWTFGGDSQSWGSRESRASSFAALALDVLQAGGEEKLAGLLTPPACLAPSRSYLHTSSALVPARSLQTERLAGAAATELGKPFLGSPKSQTLQQVLPKPDLGGRM